jgi:hypothetical protein
VHDRFQEWEQAGFFKVLWQAGLEEYDEGQGIEWEWQAVVCTCDFCHAVFSSAYQLL